MYMVKSKQKQKKKKQYVAFSKQQLGNSMAVPGLFLKLYSYTVP